MLDYISAKDQTGKDLTTSELFFQLTDDDFIILQEEGHLESICNALSVDLQAKKFTKNEC